MAAAGGFFTKEELVRCFLSRVLAPRLSSGGNEAAEG